MSESSPSLLSLDEPAIEAATTPPPPPQPGEHNMRLHSEGPEPPQSTLNAHLRRHIHNHQLEFVQSLASPAYLHYLATSGILYQFLRYLLYWKKPEYAKYLQYPHCLYFLDLLVPPPSYDSLEDVDGTTGVDIGEAFRREIAQVPFRNFVHEQQFYSWQFRSARLYGSSKEEEDATSGGK